MPSFHRLELVRRTLQRQGAAAAAGMLRRQLRDQIFGQYRLLFAMTGVRAAAVEEMSGSALGIRRIAGRGDIDDSIHDMIEENRRQIWWDVGHSLDTGALTWIGEEDGKPVCIAQTRRGDRIDAYFFPMTEACVLISHCATLPAWRGRGHYVTMLRHLCRTLAGEGATRLYIDCSDTNFASERGILSAGFLPIGRGQHRRDGRLVWWQESFPSVSRVEAGEARDAAAPRP